MSVVSPNLNHPRSNQRTMATRTITVSANLPVAPERAYAVLADYLDGHRRILPPQFTEMTVEQGGIGAGTIIRCQMTAFGR